MTAEVRVFDLRDEPVELSSQKFSLTARRDPRNFRGVVLHQWGSPVGTEARERRRWKGEDLALARRALKAPYTISAGVTSAGVPVVAIAHPLERYTFASDAGNREWLAVGIMGRFAYDRRLVARGVGFTCMDEAMDVAVATALDLAAHVLAEHTAYVPPWPLIAHRQCMNGPHDHAACPGESVVAAALRSPVVRGGTLVADADHVLDPNFGRPWPKHWRDHLVAPRQTTLDLPSVA